jgi:hypothetical protein
MDNRAPVREYPWPDALARSLRAKGLPFDVEVRDRVAVLTGADSALVGANRLTLVRLAKGHGFTHVAVEVTAGRGDDTK